MNYASVVRVLALLMLILAGAALSGAGVAAAFGETPQVIAFGATALSLAVFGSSVLLLSPKPARRARPSDALAVVLLWWLMAPLASALPFVFGVANDSPMAAVFEATSCLTTTGHSTLVFGEDGWPASLIYWRGLLHLIGAYAAVVMAAGVFAAINLGGPGIHRTVLFTVPDTSYFDAMPRIYVAVGLMLGISTAFILLLLLVAGVPPGRALADAVSVITTGLVLPGAAAAAPLSLAASVVLTFGMVIGALGLAIWLPLRVGSVKSAALDPETVTFAALAVLFAAALIPLGFALDDAAAWSVSALSTSGLPLSVGAAGASVPLTLHVLPGLIGGSALAAAGGIKIARFIVLGRRAGQEFLQLGYRRSVLSFRFRDRELDERSVIGVWVYFIGYVVAVFVLMTAFSFAGDAIGDSIRLAIGGLTSSGGLIATAERAVLTPAEQGLLVIAMLLGRVEILTVLPALSLSFWRG
ncbi:potassium transporter TrkG [Hyphomonas sp.]|uniref:potassium transporter TrkG n=1 Tax=Hyphomonas sp. TaxID=87 RepID=UPI00391D66C3